MKRAIDIALPLAATVVLWATGPGVVAASDVDIGERAGEVIGQIAQVTEDFSLTDLPGNLEIEANEMMFDYDHGELRYGGDVNYAAKEAGQSALTSAITAGEPDVVAVLIELGANVNQQAPDGDTPLKMAKNGDQDDVVAMLKAAGAKE